MISGFGRYVGKGPENDQAVDWVRRNCKKHFVKGNWDDGMAEIIKKECGRKDDFYWKQLGEERIKWLDNLPLEDEVLIGGWWFRLLHGRPVDRLYQAYDGLGYACNGFQVQSF